MLVCSVLIGTMLAAVLELRDKLSSHSTLSVSSVMCCFFFNVFQICALILAGCSSSLHQWPLNEPKHVILDVKCP